MTSRSKLAAAVLAAIVLAGCSQQAVFTPASDMCHFTMERLAVDIPVPHVPGQEAEEALLGAPGQAEQQAMSPFARKIANSIVLARTEKAVVEEDPDAIVVTAALPVVLAMSGGSEQGAFGAGVLSGWQRTGQLPRFEVVTGISTGAILSTFAFVGDAAAAKAGYTITREEDLLTPFIKPVAGEITDKHSMTLVRRGAFGDLEPLRSRLHSFYSDAMLREVAAGWADGRRLYVGAVDVDSGDAVAFDMGEMANRFAEDRAGRAALWKDCYISAVIASSSVPLAAPPAFIDNHMYIDGGARFGLFTDAMIEAAEAAEAERSQMSPSRLLSAPLDEDEPLVPVIYTIVNGTLELGGAPRCAKLDPKLCTPDNPRGGKEGRHAPWKLTTLALDTEKILVNQIYRFSADRTADQACDDPGCLNFLRIETDWRDHRWLDIDPSDGQEKELSCSEWLALDKRHDNPVQFHQRYMRCLISYGENRAGEAGWGAHLQSRP